MALHIGKKIKEVLEQSSFSVTDFAAKINKSRTVVYDIFERQTIDTGLLQTIGKVLDYDFFHYYSENSFSTLNEERAHYVRKINELEKRNELLEKVNTLLEEKRDKKIK
ncbi:MAG: hypothetical protein ACKOXB_02455 [Flavobacteriales bacterium]